MRRILAHTPRLILLTPKILERWNALAEPTDILARWTLGNQVWEYSRSEHEADIAGLPPENLPPPDPIMHSLMITNPFNYFTSKNYYAIAAFNGKLNLGSAPVQAILKFEWFVPPIPAEETEGKYAPKAR